ncbi:MAG: VWA domain-containing protein [Pseudomonadota bacterium]|nr:VWA domain-containing protein [Pseudomonadota bacterium]
MHWIRPDAFWLMLLLIPIIVWFVRHRVNTSGWSQVVDPHLLPHLLTGARTSRHYGGLLAFALAWIVAVIALAGPAWQKVEQPVMKSRQPLVILLDASAAMLAGDVKPTRFDRAKFKIIDLLRNRPEGEAALIAFTAEPYVVAPLTQDARTIENLMPALSPDIMPAPGQNLALALKQAQELLAHADQQQGDILLVTGGIDNIASALPVLKQLHQQGINTRVLAIGTEAGAPLLDPNGGFLHDAQGKMQMATMNPDALRQLARAGGGTLELMTVDQRDIQSLVKSMIPRWSAKDKPVSEAMYWQDEGHWVILLLLPFVIVLFRRGFL